MYISLADLLLPLWEKTIILRVLGGVIVLRCFGKTVVEGKIQTIQYCRANNISFLGRCYGLFCGNAGSSRIFKQTQLAESFIQRTCGGGCQERITATFLKGMCFTSCKMQPIISTTSKENIANDTGSVSFPCPKCGYENIIRSSKERKNVTKYVCPSCGFVGPN